MPDKIPPATEEIKPDVDWDKVDREVVKQNIKKAEEIRAEDAEWQLEIATLMGRASDSGLSFECIDLTTGNVVSPVIGEDNKSHAPTGAMKMRTGFSVGKQKEVAALMDRSNIIVLDIADLANPIDPTNIDPGLVEFESNKLAEELGQITRRLYTLFTVNPIITEEWLLENEEKWRVEDLAVLITRYRQRQVEMGVALGKICSKRNRRNVGRISQMAKSDLGAVESTQR